ncbi:unnamed protein product [Malus baccata var. baccata]
MRIGAITTFQNSQHPDLKETLSALHNDPTTTTVVLSGSDRNVLDDCEDVDFGRLQARDMLQHLWTGPISNASVDVVEGSRSVEVQAVGPTKTTDDLFVFFSFLKMICFGSGCSN